MKTLSRTLFCAILTLPASVFAVSEAALLFLLIEPSAKSAGVGHLTQASFSPSPTNAMMNPAQAAFLSDSNGIHAEFFPERMRWLPGFGIDNLNLNAYSVLGGIRRGNFSFVAGYSRFHINLGIQTYTGPSGPDPLGTFDSYEYADIATFALRWHGLLDLGFGINLKRVKSALGPEVNVGGSLVDGSATANMFDIGIVAHRPIVSLREGDGTGPGLELSGGASVNNIGGYITYIVASQKDPLPREARIGVGARAFIGAVNSKVGQHTFLSLEAGLEARQLLAKAEITPNDERIVGYRSAANIFGLIDDLVSHNPGTDAVAEFGLDLNLAEVVSLRYGHYRDDSGSVKYHTEGLGFQLTGLLKLIAANTESGSIWQWFNRHLILEYNTAELEQLSGPIGRTKYKSFRISLTR